MYHEKLPETKLNSTFPTLKVLGWLAVILMAIVVVYLLGPQVEVDESVQTPELPEDLNAYLWISEAQYTLRPGTDSSVTCESSTGLDSELDLAPISVADAVISFTGMTGKFVPSSETSGSNSNKAIIA